MYLVKLKRSNYMSKKMNILTVSLFYPGSDMPGGNGSNGVVILAFNV